VLYLTPKGEGTSTIRPVSETEFLMLGSAATVRFEMKEGKVVALVFSRPGQPDVRLLRR